MDKTKWIIISVLFAVVLIGFSAIFFKSSVEKGMSFYNPVLSDDGSILAYLSIKESDKKEGETAKIAIKVLDFNKRERKECTSIDIKQKEDIIIKSVSDDDIIYSKNDYSSGTIEDWSFSFADNANTQITTSKAEDFKDETIFFKKNAKQRLILKYEKNKRSILTFVNENVAEIKIMEMPTSKGYIYKPCIVGENILFKTHVNNDGVFSDAVWIYRPEIGVLDEIQRECSDYIASENGKYIVFLLPSNVKGKSLWEISVKQLEENGDSSDIANECFKEEVFLYSWSPNSTGFLMQKGNNLCFYDLNTQTVKKLQSAENDGWWGYPLSSYYTAFKSDGKFVAVLSYAKMKDEQGGYSEHITIIDTAGEIKKKIYDSRISDFGKKQPFRPEFYKHIFWKDDSDIIFESKSPNNPEYKRIIMTSGDGKNKKNLSKSFL